MLMKIMEALATGPNISPKGETWLLDTSPIPRDSL